MKISKKKPFIPIAKSLWSYLAKYDRVVDLPIEYNDLSVFHESFPLQDKSGTSTLWDTVMYKDADMVEIQKRLTMLYSLIKTEGDLEILKHLRTERIDFCHFGNSQPFRVKIVNILNDNYDYMYIKKADASRVFGLELEHLLSPNFISYVIFNDTLIEEHIAGIPGDMFYEEYIHSKNFNKVRFTKEFIKFNERCFVRLLGDMRSYNYVIDITPDFEDEQYRIKAIDFDQQSYEGHKNVYRPQFFKENYPIVKLGMEFLTVEIREFRGRKEFETAIVGVAVTMIQDVGVAGPHRLPLHLPKLAGADAVVVVAGMEGALPSVVGGHVDCPSCRVTPGCVRQGLPAARLVGTLALRA